MTTAGITATIRVRDITNAVDRDHYLVAAYDSIEAFNQRIVVVIPELMEPAWVLRPGARNARRSSNVMALAVPSVDALTLEVAHQLTRILTDYITVRDFPRKHRRSGLVRPGELVHTFNGRSDPSAVGASERAHA